MTRQVERNPMTNKDVINEPLVFGQTGGANAKSAREFYETVRTPELCGNFQIIRFLGGNRKLFAHGTYQVEPIDNHGTFRS